MKKTPWMLGYWTLLRMSIRMKKKLPVYMPTREFIDGCWRLAFLDDMVCRHELNGVVIKGEPIVFPPKKESIPYRYKLFLEMYGDDTAEVWKKAYGKTWKRAKALREK